MSIGTVKLADGRSVKGFLVEAAATAGARDISELRRLARVSGAEQGAGLAQIVSM